MILSLLLLSAFLVSLFCTCALIRFNRDSRLTDVPSARSSHCSPIPRVGGIGILLAFYSASSLASLFGWRDSSTLYLFLGPALLVAVVGFLDDLHDVAVKRRLLVHSVAVAWLLTQRGGFPPLLLFDTAVDFGLTGNVLAALFLVWLINLYNFMDGIDGLAAIEAITVCVGGVLLAFISADSSGLWWVEALLACSAAGFLVWNFPRALAFMGDAGSSFLGMCMGIFALDLAWRVPNGWWSWMILLGCFIVDATITLVRRLLRSQKLYEAHRSHAYQYAARKHGSHSMVTMVVALINLIWLLPMSILVSVGILDGFVGLMISYLPLAFLAVRYKAGAVEQQSDSP